MRPVTIQSSMGGCIYEVVSNRLTCCGHIINRLSLGSEWFKMQSPWIARCNGDKYWETHLLRSSRLWCRSDNWRCQIASPVVWLCSSYSCQIKPWQSRRRTGLPGTSTHVQTEDGAQCETKPSWIISPRPFTFKTYHIFIFITWSI